MTLTLRKSPCSRSMHGTPKASSIAAGRALLGSAPALTAFAVDSACGMDMEVGESEDGCLNRAGCVEMQGKRRIRVG